MPSIFISYRRADSSAVTGRIHEHLVAAFHDKNVFKDVDDIQPGVDFRREIERSIAACEVMLVIIGKDWANDKRLADPDDFVRLEVESALRSPTARVIPILVENAAMPTRDVLPLTMHELVYRNALAIRDDPDFPQDMKRLIALIRESHPKPRPLMWQFAAAAVIVLVLALVALVLLTGGDSSGTNEGELSVLFAEDFEGGSADQFQNVDGVWQLVTDDDENHAFRGMGLDDGMYPAAYFGSRDWTDYIVEVRVKPVELGEGTQITIRTVDGNNSYMLDFLKGSDDVSLAQLVNGVYETLSYRNIPLHYDDWNTVRLEVQADRISAFVNDEALTDVFDDTFSEGRVSLQMSPQTTALFDDITIWSYDED